MGNSSKTHFIHYVRDQEASLEFFQSVWGHQPTLDVPGMTEFTVTEKTVIGLMPKRDVVRLLDLDIAEVSRSSIRGEIYSVVLSPGSYHQRVLAAGAKELSALAPRSWGDQMAVWNPTDMSLPLLARFPADHEQVSDREWSVAIARSTRSGYPADVVNRGPHFGRADSHRCLWASRPGFIRHAADASREPLDRVKNPTSKRSFTMLHKATLRKSFLVVLLILLIVSQVSSVSAGTNVWTNLGPEGGIIYALAIDPTTPSTLYAGTDGGVFKSTNSGGNWSAVNTGLTSITVLSLALDPATPTTLYAGTNGGMFKSTNSGGNWGEINPAGFTRPLVFSLALDPQTPTTLYAGHISAVCSKARMVGGTGARLILTYPLPPPCKPLRLTRRRQLTSMPGHRPAAYSEARTAAGTGTRSTPA